MTECIGGNGELDEIAAATPGSPPDVSRRHSTSRAPAKRRKIVRTDKERRRLVHRIDIEAISDVPGGAGPLRVVDRSIENLISIGAAGCGEPDVESVVDTPEVEDRDLLAELGVEAAQHPFGVDLYSMRETDDLADGMHATIGPARYGGADRSSVMSEGGFELSLHGPLIGLNGVSTKARAVVRHVEAVRRHG